MQNKTLRVSQQEGLILLMKKLSVFNLNDKTYLLYHLIVYYKLLKIADITKKRGYN